MIQPRPNRALPAALILSALLGLGAAPAALALGQSRDQPIHIAADQAELDDSQGLATYRGDVVVTQGLTRLEADKVVVHRNDQGISKIVATGEQARYAEQESASAPQTRAAADTIIYTQADETLQLIRNARLEQNQNSFQGDLIRYDTLNRRVTASADKEGGTPGRVEMVIQPRNRDAAPERATDAPQ